MFAINTSITFTFNIEPMPTDPVPTAVSLALTDPDGNLEYDQDGATSGAVYVAPTTELPGSYTFTHNFPIPGTWLIILGDGTSASYKILSSSQIFIEQSEISFIQAADWNSY